MTWLVLAASCVAIVAGLEIAEMALIIVGLGGMCVGLVMSGQGLL